MSELRLDRYKVLGAANAFQEFTVRDLAGYSGVEVDYIHKLLSDPARDGTFFERVGKVSDGKQGRPPLRYRVIPDRATELQKLMDDLQREIRSFQSPGDGLGRPAIEPTSELLAAESVLFDQYPTASTAREEDALLRIADLGLKRDKKVIPKAHACKTEQPCVAVPDVASFVPDPSVPACDSRRRAASALLKLSDWVYAVKHGPRTTDGSILSFREVMRLIFVLGDLGRVVNKEYAETVENWLIRGPLAQLQLNRYLAAARDRSQQPLEMAHPSREECWPELQVCPFLAPGGQKESGKWQAARWASWSRVELVYAEEDDTATQSVAAHVEGALRSAAPQLRLHQRGPDELQASMEIQVLLLVCNSQRPTRNRALMLAEHWSRLSCSLYVLDADSAKDFQVEVYRRKAQYVSYAGQLDSSSLFLAVPALAALLHAPRLGSEEC